MTVKCNCTTFAALDLCPSPQSATGWPIQILLGKLQIFSGIIIPPPRYRGSLSVTAIRLSVCLCHGAAALGAHCTRLWAHWLPAALPFADCESNCHQRGISSRCPWGVELPSEMAYRLVAPGAVTGLPCVICPVESVEALKTAYPYYVA